MSSAQDRQNDIGGTVLYDPRPGLPTVDPRIGETRPAGPETKDWDPLDHPRVGADPDRNDGWFATVKVGNRTRAELSRLIRENPHLEDAPGMAPAHGDVAITHIIEEPLPNHEPIVRKEFPSEKSKVFKEHMASKVGEAIGAPVAATVVSMGRFDYARDFDGNILDAWGDKWDENSSDPEPAMVHFGPYVFMDYMEGDSAGDQGIGRVVPDEWLNSDEGIVLGLLDALITNGDRHAENWKLDKNAPVGKRIRGYDHSEAFRPVSERHLEDDDKDIPAPNLKWVTFVGHFVNPRPDMYGNMGWRRENPLHPDDIPVLRERLMKLKPDFERFTWAEHLWDGAKSHRAMMKTLDTLAKRATGTRRLIR